jgi:hypothetical protein
MDKSLDALAELVFCCPAESSDNSFAPRDLSHYLTLLLRWQEKPITKIKVLI